MKNGGACWVFSPVLVQAPEECPSVFSFKSKGFEKCFRSFYVETFFKFFDGDGAAAILLGKKKTLKKLVNHGFQHKIFGLQLALWGTFGENTTPINIVGEKRTQT